MDARSNLRMERLVGRRDHEHGIRAIRGGLQRRQRERRRGIAAHGLQQHGRAFAAKLAELVQCEEAMLFVAHDERLRDLDLLARKALHALHGLLKEAVRTTGENEVLLRKFRAGQRPQPGAAAAGHDDGLDP